ncbi:proline--tRNA ligase [Candidatus Woesearchaeota archaeon]|nr:proline--tRNA ligase [Candidatus Woesearchaeota archaeon]
MAENKAKNPSQNKGQKGVDAKGLTVSKETDFSEWFTQLIQKAELIEYSPVSGCYILRPTAFHIWEQVQAYLDSLFKADGVKNAYFPLFIPESLLSKESAHVEGFAPEVAWVESGGSSPLHERLAIRPTSETIICETYAKWIRSYKDLPLRLNQWCNVVRWEFKHCTPFLRSREFLWQEGHTVFAKKEEAVEETKTILDLYEDVFRNLYAVPVLKGKKSEAEKFAGAEFTLSVEAFLPNGKAIQGATSHHLGQNFSKAFGISFIDEKQQQQFAYQNSWGISTRSIGVMILMHSDDKGLVLPPKVSSVQVVIVPILFDTSRAAVLKEAQTLVKKLQKKNLSVHLDNREEYTPGWKFNEWEMKGIPVRIELGPKDLEKKQALVVRRDTGEKKAVSLDRLETEIPLLLETIQQSLLEKAEKHLRQSIVAVTTLKEAEKQLEAKKLLFAPWCGKPACEESLKEKTGAKSLNSPLEQSPLKKGQACFACSSAAQSWFYFGKSY